MLSAKKEYNLPERIDLGRKFSSVMGHFVSNLRESQVPHESYIDGEQYDLSEGCRKVCGYIAPPFQRPLEWTDQQKIRFIESAFMGLNLGTVTIHEASCNNVKNLSLIKATPFSGWIIDGQQRLSAIEAFLTDQIEVYGAYWSDLSRRDQRRFESIPFSQHLCEINDLKKIEDLYHRLAYGGTPHEAAALGGVL